MSLPIKNVLSGIEKAFSLSWNRMEYLGITIRLKMASDILLYKEIRHQVCINLVRATTSCYLASGKHVALKGNRFSDSYFREKQTWISLRHTNANDERSVSSMNTARYLWAHYLYRPVLDNCPFGERSFRQ